MLWSKAGECLTHLQYVGNVFHTSNPDSNGNCVFLGGWFAQHTLEILSYDLEGSILEGQ